MCQAFNKQLMHTSVQKQTHISILSEKYVLILNRRLFTLPLNTGFHLLLHVGIFP